MSMGWQSNNLLPAVSSALRDELGQYRKPRNSVQLARWLRADGCAREARQIESNERLFRDVLAWFREELRDG